MAVATIAHQNKIWKIKIKWGWLNNQIDFVRKNKFEWKPMFVVILVLDRSFAIGITRYNIAIKIYIDTEIMN